LTEGTDSKIQLYDDYDEDEITPMNNTISDKADRSTGAFSKLERQFNQIARLSGINKNNLSKSIIIHHNKNASLL
jgi:hypothetical protein